MPHIDAPHREKLRQLFDDELRGDVRFDVRVHERACATCERASDVLGEIAELSSRLSLEVAPGEGSLPEVRLAGSARGEVRFIGLPSGYEFPTLIDAVVAVSQGSSSLAPETLAELSKLHRSVRLQVFTTPT